MSHFFSRAGRAVADLAKGGFRRFGAGPKATVPGGENSFGVGHPGGGPRFSPIRPESEENGVPPELLRLLAYVLNLSFHLTGTNSSRHSADVNSRVLIPAHT